MGLHSTIHSQQDTAVLVEELYSSSPHNDVQNGVDLEVGYAGHEKHPHLRAKLMSRLSQPHLILMCYLPSD